MPKITCPSCTTSYDLPDGSIKSEGQKVKCATCGTKWLAKPESIAIADPVLDSVASGGSDDVMRDWENAEPDSATKWISSSSAEPFDDVDTTLQNINPDDDVELQMPAVVQEMPRQGVIDPLMRSNSNQKRKGTTNRYEISERKRAKRDRILHPTIFLVSLMLIAGVIYIRNPIVRLMPDLASLYAYVGFDVNLRGFEIHDVRSERVVESAGPVLIVTGKIQNVTKGIAQAPLLRFSLKTNTNEEIYGWDHELSVPTIVPGGEIAFQSRLPQPPALGRKLSVRFTDS